MNCSIIKRCIDFPADKKYKEEIENNLSTDSYIYEIIMCYIILFMQSFMAVLFLLKKGGPFTSMRSSGYFSCYIFLFLTTLVYLIVFNWGKRIYSASFHQNARTIYAVIICLWTSGVPILDQLGGGGISVFSYIIPVTAATVILKPWQSMIIFSSEFIVLNILLVLFSNGTNNMFGNILNSIFITILSIFISIRLYRSKVISYYDRIVIRKQYQEILQINHKLSILAMTDELTGMWNRRYLEEVVRKMLCKPEVRGNYVAGIMTDIDFFKLYNDEYGHQAGDECLKEVAKEIKHQTENESTCVIRYGGEEIFICLFECNQRSALKKAESLRLSIENKRIECNGSPFGYVTISVGVYSKRIKENVDLDEFIEKADKALYEAKNKGKNKVLFYK